MYKLKCQHCMYKLINEFKTLVNTFELSDFASIDKCFEFLIHIDFAKSYLKNPLELGKGGQNSISSLLAEGVKAIQSGIPGVGSRC
jgi:hypothetical protein